ncbi:MAG: helix-turn-helix family protein [Herminiimonas sp.]|nr:helix-turn-helix family protein [Herminiimonas sp.]
MGIELQVRPEVLGVRLKSARALAKLTQDAAAQKLGFARTTVVAIEAGKRPISPEEIRAFSELYRISESELLAGSLQPLDMEVKFRTVGGLDELNESQMIVGTLLNRLAASTVEIEQMVGSRVPKMDFPTITLNRSESLEQQAEDAALSVRQRLGIGLGPISDLTAIMESDFGLRVFERPLPAEVGGAVIFDEIHGGFVLLNSNHSQPRRRLTAGHEICHPLLRKAGLAILFEDDRFDEREDKFCDVFARALLMPAVAVRRKAIELKTLAGDFTVRHLLMMSIYFYVSIEAMARRLENLDIVPKGLSSSLKDRRLGIPHLEEVRKEMGSEPKISQFTPRLLLLAGAAYDRELLSEQQIAKKLELDLVTVRKMLAEVSGLGGNVVDLTR